MEGVFTAEPTRDRGAVWWRTAGAVIVGVCAIAVSGCGGSRSTTSAGQVHPVSPQELARHVHTLPMTARVPTQVTQTCQSATRQHPSVPVYCPRVVPRGPIGHVAGIPDSDLFGAIVVANHRDLYELSFNSGQVRGRQHWIVGAGRRPTVERLVVRGVENEQGAPAALIGIRQMEGQRVLVYRFPDPGGGMHAGHVGAVVLRGTLAIFASVHGYAHADAAVAMVVDMASRDGGS